MRHITYLPFVAALVFGITALAENKVTTVSRHLLSAAPDELVISLPTDRSAANLKLYRHDIRSERYFAEATGKAGRRRIDPKVALYRSQDGADGDFARLSIIESKHGAKSLFGIFQKEGELYGISPVDKSDIPGARTPLSNSSLAEVVVRKLEGKELGSCVSSDKGSRGQKSKLSSEGRRPLNIPSYPTIEIATEADHDYVVAAGGVAQANALILSILNGVDGILRRDTGIGLKVTYQHAWTTKSDPYSGSVKSGLRKFTKVWNSSFKGRVPYDIAHYFKGTTRKSGQVGLAWLGAVCASYNYSASEKKGNGLDTYVPLVAHEIGHNLGAKHDSDRNFIMYPTLVAGLNSFAEISKTEIMNTVSTVGSCLDSDEVLPGLPPPSPPERIRASDGRSATKVTVSWKKVPGAMSYYVYRSTTEGDLGQLLGETTKVTFSDTTAKAGQKYYYAVKTAVGPDTSAPTAQVRGSLK